MLDNRELSIAVWLAVFLAWGFSKPEVRKAGAGIVRAALAWKIALCALMMALYIALTVFGLSAAGLWGVSQLKATILWVFTAALVMVFEIGSVVNSVAIDQNITDASPRLRFSAAVTEFAEILRESPWAQDGSLEAVLAEAQGAIATMDDTPRDREFVDLVQRAIQISGG